jgi:hypothetical protein
MKRVLASSVWFSQVLRAWHGAHLLVGAHPCGRLGVAHPQQTIAHGVGSYKGQSGWTPDGHKQPLKNCDVRWIGAVYVA